MPTSRDITEVGSLQIITVVADDASNNDTLVASLECRFEAVGIQFTADMARMRCCPHIIHLSASEVCFLPVSSQFLDSLLV